MLNHRPPGAFEDLVDEISWEYGPSGRTVRLVTRLQIDRELIAELAVRGQEALLTVITGDPGASIKRQYSQLTAALKERLRIEGERRADEERLQLALEVSELGVCEIRSWSGRAPLKPSGSHIASGRFGDIDRGVDRPRRANPAGVGDLFVLRGAGRAVL